MESSKERLIALQKKLAIITALGFIPMIAVALGLFSAFNPEQELLTFLQDQTNAKTVLGMG